MMLHCDSRLMDIVFIFNYFHISTSTTIAIARMSQITSKRYHGKDGKIQFLKKEREVIRKKYRETKWKKMMLHCDSLLLGNRNICLIALGNCNICRITLNLL